MKGIGKPLLYLAFISLLIQGCSEEEPPPPHPIVGEWALEVLDIVSLSFVSGPIAENELDVSFDAFWGGQYLPENYLPDSPESYEITFNNDNTLSRRLGFIGPDDVKEGTWEVDESITNLTLSIDGEPFDEEFEFVGDILDTEMTWSKVEVNQVLIYPDALISDTLTNWSFETQERFDQISATVSWEVYYIFERKN